jgi:hypothetical protein
MMETCLYCDEPTLPGERTELTTYVDEGVATKRLVHFECSARQVLGSVGHQRRTCSCFGGTEDDPPGATRREAAVAALEEARRRMSGRPVPVQH